MVKARLKRLITITAAFVAAAIMFISPTGGGAVFASAASSYSSALDDLRTDKNFNVADYPAGGNSYTLDVIQVAESTDGELFVYCYQPYGKITASSISISKTIGDSYSPKKYSLSRLNSDDVFYKYIVNGFELEPDALRYYNISQIWRKYDRQIDGDQQNGQVLEEVPYKVGKLWTASTVAGAVSYTEKETETVEIVNPYPGFVRYPNGTGWGYTTSCDGHFVTFDVGNYDIDRLLSADVTYRTQDYATSVASGTTYGELSEPQYKTLNHDEKAGNSVNGLFGVKYSWDRISRTTDFVNDVNITDETLKSELLARTWVLNFLETSYTVPVGGDNVYAAIFGGSLGYVYNGLCLVFGETKGTQVKEVAVLRLEFEVDGKVYNLGTVSKVVTGSEKPAETKPDMLGEILNEIAAKLAKIPWWAWVLIIIAVVVVVVGVLSIFFPIVGKILKVIWRVISAPFRGIAKAAKRGRERRERKRATTATKNRKGAKK